MNLRLLLLEDNPRDEELILRALKKDPADRFQSVREFASPASSAPAS